MSLFSGCSLLREVNIGSLDLKNVKLLSYMFSDCKELKSIDLSNVKLGSKVDNIACMFSMCESLEEIKMCDIRSSARWTVDYTLFIGCYSLKLLDLSRVKNVRAVLFILMQLKLINSIVKGLKIKIIINKGLEDEGDIKDYGRNTNHIIEYK